MWAMIKDAVWLTIALASITTLCLVIIATPIAWWLAKSRNLIKDVATSIIALPIVLPPTVLGFYLLVAMGPKSPLMDFLSPLGIRTLNFTFAGLVIGSIIYSLPFAVQPLKNAFEGIGARPLEVAATLGASPIDSFFNVALPLARRGFLTAAILVFAHTVGEFGVVLMIGGAIPGKTEVVSIRIFQMVEQMDWNGAHALASGLMAFAFLVLLALLVLDRKLGSNGRSGA